MASLKKANMRRSWETSWLKKDFSWNGLSSKRPPEGAQGANYQTFLRSLSGGHTDEALQRAGVLVECKGGELYHVLHIPCHWIKRYVENTESLFVNREKIFEQYRSKVQNLSSSTGYGVCFYDGEKYSFVNQIRRLNYCYIGPGLCLLEKQSNLFLRNVFVEGDLSSSDRFNSNIVLDIGTSYICGSMSTHAPDGRWIDLTIKHSRVAEALKISGCTVRRVHLAHSTVGSISIDECKVESRCELANVSIPSGLTFDSSDFDGQVSISEAEIASFARFIDCDFEDRVVFRDVQWPFGKVTSAFTTGSRFKELVTFTSRETPPIQLFDGGEFEANVGFDSRYHGRWDEAFLNELKSQDFDEQKAAVLASKLEAASRNLRNLAQARGDAPMEHFWHRAEIIARRKTSSVRGLERFASDAYGAFADYGLSIGKPFGWLLGLIVIFGLVYAYAGGTGWTGDLDLGSLEQGLGYSLHQSLPLGVFKDPEKSWLERLLGGEFSISTLGIRVLATVQTIVSAILIYLGVMAVRRKFKIG